MDLRWIGVSLFFEIKKKQKSDTPCEFPLPLVRVLQARGVSEGDHCPPYCSFSAVFRELKMAYPLAQVSSGGDGRRDLAFSLWRNLPIWLAGSVVQSYFYLCHHQGVLLDSPFILSKSSCSVWL